MHFLGYQHSHDDEFTFSGTFSGPTWLRLMLLLLAAAAGWLLWSSVFFVDETEYVYVTQFGEPLRLYVEPGLHVKRPYQSLWRFDRRLQMYEPPAREMLTEDKENLNFQWYVCWRLPSPEFAAQHATRSDIEDVPDDAPMRTIEPIELYVRRFLQSVGGVQAAESRLEERVQAAIAAEIGRARLSELASLEADSLQLEPIMQRVTDSLRASSLEQFGIEVVDVRLKRFNYPEAVKPAVFAEIRSERERVAVQYRAEGESEKIRVESQATLERDRLLAQAQREATRLRGEGEAKAMEIFNAAHSKDPAFYQLLKTLETYRNVLDDQTTVVLSADSPLLKLLTRGLPALKETPRNKISPIPMAKDGDEVRAPQANAAPTTPAGGGAP
ncbi:MAG TPA: protease modulator HflC [Pirellulales bacterium]|nr:protease modulator HflC [Pirellulales bacterium]